MKAKRTRLLLCKSLNCFDKQRPKVTRKPIHLGNPGYYRLHGSPKIYYSAYEPEVLASVARDLVTRADRGAEVWCIFDNTALGAATDNALSTRELVSRQRP